MSEQQRARTAKEPSDRPARDRLRGALRGAHAAEARGVAAVCAAEAKVTAATARRDKARADLVAVSGVDRAALLLGIGIREVRHSVALANGAERAQ